mgnify:CR=1 FL=1
MQLLEQTSSMGLADLKLYCLNITSFTVASFDWLEPSLKVMLLVLTIGYTAHKWYNLKKGK